MRKLTVEQEEERRKCEALGLPWYPPPRTVFGRRILPFFYSDRFVVCLFAAGSALLMLGGIPGIAGSRGVNDPAWAVSGPGLMLMVLAALMFG
jgi:hypothetical protein